MPFPRPFRSRLAALALLPIGLVLVDALGWPRVAPWALARWTSASGAPDVQWHPDTRVRLLVAPVLRTPALRVPGAPGAPARLNATAVEVAWRWTDLWAWWREGAPLRLRSLQADTLDAVWLRDAQGRDNWRDLRPGAAAQRPAQPPAIEHLAVQRGRLRVDDAALDLQVDVQLGRPEPWRWHARAEGQWRGQALDATVTTGEPLPLLLPSEAPSAREPLQADLRHGATRLRFQGTAASLLDARALAGDLQLQGPSLQASGRSLGLSLPHTPAYRLVGALSHAGGRWQLHEVQARVGASRLKADLAVDTGGPRPLLTGRFAGGPLRLVDLAPTVGADERPRRPGRVLPDRPFDLPALRAMDADVRFDLASLDLGSASLQPFSPVRARLLLRDGQLRLEELEAGAAGGTVRGSVSLDSTQNPPAWRTALTVDGLHVEHWLRSPEPPLRGRLHAELELQGRGAHVAALLAGANGRVRLSLDRGSVSHLWTELAGLDLAEALGVWVRGDRPLPLQCATLHAEVRDGVLTPRVALMDNADSRVELRGSVNLRQESLALRATATPHDGSPFSLRSPLRVQGSFADPRVSLSGSAVGRKVLVAAALSALAAPAGLLAFVDPGEAPQPPPCSVTASRPTG